MQEDMVTLHLLPAEQEILQRIHIDYFDQSESTQRNASNALTVTREQAEVLREKLTFLMASEGFNEEYEPTSYGHSIQLLIDRLFIR